MKQKLLEKEILSSLVSTNSLIPKALQVISIDDFIEYRNHAQVIFDSWKNEKNIITELRAKGYKLSDIDDDSYSGRTITATCKELKNLTAQRILKEILSDAQKAIPDGNIEAFVGDIQQKLIKVVETSDREDTDIDSALEEFTEYQNLFEEKKKTGAKLLGLSTGYEKLDDVIDGLRKKHLWVIGGYTSLGKTFSALNILNHLLKQGLRTTFYSLEMSRVDITSRILGINIGDNGNAIVKGFADKVKVQNAMELMRKSNMSIHTTKRELSQIILSMYEESIKNRPELIVIDFLQLVTVKGTKSEYEATTQAILALQTAAQRFDVPIIVLSQVSNDGAKAGDQQVMGFKGSGAIAAAADLAIELVSGEESIKDLREKMNKGEPVLIKWHIKKNRHGRVGSMTMEFTGKTGVFIQHDENKF